MKVNVRHHLRRIKRGSIPVRKHTRKNRGMAFDLTKKTGYPIADYPESYNKTGKTKLVDPVVFIEGVRKQYGNNDTFDKFIESKKKHGGDESNTSIEEFKDLIKSKEKILPPVVMEYKKGKPSFFEGAHRAIAAYELGEKLPARVIHEQKKVKGIGIFKGEMVWPIENEHEKKRLDNIK